jgi:acetoin utilization deacetylase AcuC-like enzyme
MAHFLSGIFSGKKRSFRAGGKKCIFQWVRGHPGFKAEDFMKTVYSEKHALHCPAQSGGETGPTEYFEKPDRAFTILKHVRERALGPVLPPETAFGEDIIRRIHAPRYVDFLAQAYDRWIKAGRKEGLFFPSVSALQNPAAREPRIIEGQLGLYLADAYVAFMAGTWQAVLASAHTALTAQKIAAGGERAAFALCRPPGHHAAAASAAGFCFINNAAAAAQAFIDQGADRVAVLDVDYHHGNGTQGIFYDRDDVLFVSLHADPADDYPFYLGYRDETGAGRGEGFNLNYPLALGTDYGGWAAALDDGLARIRKYGPDALVVSLGVDTFAGDPISQFKLLSADFTDMGGRIAGLRLPTLFVMEGGYAVDEIGLNVTNVLAGFSGGR